MAQDEKQTETSGSDGTLLSDADLTRVAGGIIYDFAPSDIDIEVI